MPSPLEIAGFYATDIHSKISLLINNLISISDPSGHFLLELPDGRIIDTKGWHDWEWTHGIGLYGLWQYHISSSSPSHSQSPAPTTTTPSALRIIQDWFAEQLPRGTTKNINTMSPFLTLAYLYSDPTTTHVSYLPWLESWADWAMNSLPRTQYSGFQHITYLEENKNQLWDDTLMMTVLPLAKIGQLLNRPAYIEEAKRQFLLHITYLFDTSTNLFFHGWEFNPSSPSSPGHNFARARWARGNAWLTIAIPDFLELLNLPSHDSFHLHLLSVLNAQCSALKHLQSDDGMWYTLLDVPTMPGNYEEASATAGFAYGLLKSIRKRYISAEEYTETAMKAVKAVISRISDDGELRDVSFGTAMGRDLQHYLDIEKTSMPYGQAMGVMALVEFLRCFI